ncbi:CvpA family protein [Candidatus Poribacteria bacterium]|nr:CvpA family protein [Candidatus Poribacteria bacterium]
MSKLDFAIFIIVGIAGFGCYRAGFTRSIWGVFAIGAGLVVASQFWPDLSIIVQKVIASESVSIWISIIVLIVITSIVIDTLFERIQRIFEKGILGWLNSVLGLGIGIATSGLIIAVLLSSLNPYMSEFFINEIDNSLFAERLMNFGEEVWVFSKEKIKKHLDLE